MGNWKFYDSLHDCSDKNHVRFPLVAQWLWDAAMYWKMCLQRLGLACGTLAPPCSLLKTQTPSLTLLGTLAHSHSRGYRKLALPASSLPQVLTTFWLLPPSTFLVPVARNLLYLFTRSPSFIVDTEIYTPARHPTKHLLYAHLGPPLLLWLRVRILHLRPFLVHIQVYVLFSISLINLLWRSISDES